MLAREPFWFFFDRLCKAAVNVLVVYVAYVALSDDSYYQFISLLTYYYLMYAISTLGLDSRVYSHVEKNRIQRSIVNSYLFYRVCVSGVCGIGYVLFCYLLLGVVDFYLICMFVVVNIVRVFDIYEFLLIGCGKKIEYSKIGVTFTLIFSVLKVGAAMKDEVSILVSIYLIEAVSLVIAYKVLVSRSGIIVAGANKVICSAGDVFRLFANSALGLGVSRFDQIYMAPILSKELFVAYLTVVRFYEPVLTFFQVASTYFVSSKLILREGCGGAVVALFLVVSIIHAVLFIVLGEVFFLEAIFELGVGTVLLLSCLYCLNGIRVLSGKLLVYRSLMDVLLVRALVGAGVLLLFTFAYSGTQIEVMICGICLAIASMNAISYYKMSGRYEKGCIVK